MVKKKRKKKEMQSLWKTSKENILYGFSTPFLYLYHQYMLVFDPTLYTADTNSLSGSESSPHAPSKITEFESQISVIFKNLDLNDLIYPLAQTWISVKQLGSFKYKTTLELCIHTCMHAYIHTEVMRDTKWYVNSYILNSLCM